MSTRFATLAFVALILALAVTPQLASSQVCMKCGIPESGFCASGVGPRHQDWESSQPDWYDADEAWHFECLAGQNAECEDHHANECVGNLSTNLVAAIRSEDSRRIVALLATTDRYYVNWERGAIQGKACKGDAVVRHIPVTDKLLSQIRAHLTAELLGGSWQAVWVLSSSRETLRRPALFAASSN